MSLGVCMKGFNALYQKSALDFFFEFVPQILFLLALFGTMDALIISKWLTNWQGRESEAPSIIAQMISNVLSGGEVQGTPLLSSSEEGQAQLVNSLLLLCLVCVPLLLFVKPWVINKRNQEAH